jgi:hypothetical protein
MVRKYTSIVKGIEKARNERRVTSINPCKEIAREIARLLKIYLPRKVQLNVELQYNGIPSYIMEVNHNNISEEKLNKKIIRQLGEVKVTYKVGGREYRIVVSREEGQRIASRLSREYNLLTGRKLTF